MRPALDMLLAKRKPDSEDEDDLEISTVRTFTDNKG